MKSSKQLTKRSFSPLMHKNIETSAQRKKKTHSNCPTGPYKAGKDFDSRHRTDRKRQSNYLKQLLKQSDSGNKYRLVTEPVDERIMSIASFAPHSKQHHDHSSHKIRHLSNERRQKQETPTCSQCQQYREELGMIKAEVAKVFASKMLWKTGDMTLPRVKEEFGLGQGKSRSKAHKVADQVTLEIKRHCYDLMKDIEVLSDIDYPKMLNMKVFKYEPLYGTAAGSDEMEIKSLLNQVRNHYEGKINHWDLQDDNEQSDHTKAIMRNMKCRLSHCLRENLQLRSKKMILERAEEISTESEEYLRHMIQEVLASYSPAY